MPGTVFYKENPEEPHVVEKILNPTVKRWFFSRFPGLSLPQRFAVNEIHCRNNVLVSAPTGATKTLTGFLSILNELVDSAEKGILEDRVYAIYISPLKALNRDIEVNLKEPLEEIEKVCGRELGIRVAVRTGDTTPYQRQKMSKIPPHILITTPESLAILLSSKNFRPHLSGVDWCIIDEIHALAENKRGVHLSLSLERLSHLSPHMARVGLSATVAPLEEIAKYLVGAERNCIIADVHFAKYMDLKVLSPLPDLINTTFSETQNALYSILDKLIQEHKTTLVFTNTRAATERIVHHLKTRFPGRYTENIGAHHGSLSKSHRHDIEKKLREGKLKCVVCSTSLELGIDIGYIDLVMCIGSPKSVARALQRIGRSGHKMHEKTKGRIIVMDRDDLVECSVLLKASIERKIDRVHIPTNCLDVLAQHIDGMAIDRVWDENELFDVVRKSYCYQNLELHDFNEVLKYLAGEYVSLEDRYIYAKVWRKAGKVGKRGKLGRVIYMTNIGTIPDESFITVKLGEEKIGKLDESFLERLKQGDIFVLGGNTYEFRFSRGMTAQVKSAAGRTPTVPSWFSEMLPLSFDLAVEIGRFRGLMLDRFSEKMSKKDILNFIDSYLYVDRNSADAIYRYFSEQYSYLKIIPTNKLILVEHYSGEDGKKVIFHSLFGRRVNDCLSRALAFIIAKKDNQAVEIGINDNGFYLSSEKPVNVMRAFELLKAEKLDIVMELAIEKSEVFRRRFRHCAGRALMILRNYKGKRKRAGRQQISSMILHKALMRIDPNFSILKEARREVLEDLMDIGSARNVLEGVASEGIRVREVHTDIPSPFAFNLALQGVMDVLKLEDRLDFLKRMHSHVLAKISLEKGKMGK